MEMFSRFIIFAALCCGLSSSADLETNGGGIYVKVIRESGQFVIAYDQNYTISVTIQLTKLTELDSSLAEIGSTGSVVHSFTSFPNATFSDIITPTVNNISTTFFTSYFTLDNAATFEMSARIYGGSGTIQTDAGQSIDVTAGNILFTFAVRSWPFCGYGDICSLFDEATNTSSNQTGAFLDTTLQFTSPGTWSQQTANITDVVKYSMGGNTILYLTEKFLDSTTVTAFPTNYPMISTKDVSFRFPMFSSFVTYGFAVDMGEDPNSGSTSGSERTSGISVLALFNLLVLSVMAKTIIF